MSFETSITKREKEIIRLIALGMSSREIADTLNISSHTVATHRKNILRKFDGLNTVGIISLAQSSGWIEQRVEYAT
jgi:DNA-binding CsgD family transcriptional regulator